MPYQNRIHFVWLITGLLLVMLMCVDEPLAQAPAENSLTQAERATAIIRGERVYNQACAVCHGVNGDGKGPAAKSLDPRPRDFTRGVYKFRSTPTGELPTNRDLFETIARGVPRTKMPAWRDLLSNEQIGSVVEYIKTFSDKFQKNKAVTPITIAGEPEVTQQTVKEGKYLYMLMECWACHGVRGKGDGKSANTLKDDWGNKIKPFDFTVGNYKGGNDHRSVYKTFNTGLNGTPMPSYADVFLFGSDTIADLSSYRDTYSNEEIAALKAYLDSQPTQTEIENMSAKEQEKLVNRRKWSLVHFAKSLSRGKSLFYKLFVEKTDETQ